jgi:hypothetical protein
MAAESKLQHAAYMRAVRAMDVAHGGRNRRPSLSEDASEHPHVRIVQDAGYQGFCLLVFRTDLSDETLGKRFPEE